MSPRTLLDENEKEYVFSPPDQNDAVIRIPGLILIVKGKTPLYIGESHDIHGFIRNSDWVRRAEEEYGATGIYVCRGRQDPVDRRAAKCGLVRRNRPVLNPAADHFYNCAETAAPLPRLPRRARAMPQGNLPIAVQGEP